ncbi:hypothetical protein [Bradyrhizobium sp. BWC-3-1]|uniref:hypothetical protein n=1 Tax=Bradyrhizobium sp. BWC-3-1 TaxID=3080012 RepID=UPI00293E87D8|nr:hypothetical protein [Bradyrhizobium sp. BWC-3-1]WOH55050.1 hypothetical protein RX329_22250 [Bradyrhizobium sp. BWC-3-1]
MMIPKQDVTLYIFSRALAEAAKELELPAGRAGLALIAEGLRLAFDLTEADAYALASVCMNHSSDLVLRAAAQHAQREGAIITYAEAGRA